MMMTAAGTIAPAKVFVMGSVSPAFRPLRLLSVWVRWLPRRMCGLPPENNAESLGGKFLVVDPDMEKDSQTEGGYAKEMPPEYFEKQKQVVAEHIKKQMLL